MKLLPEISCGYFPGSPKSCQVQKDQCGRYKPSPLTPHGSVLFVVPRVCYERSSLSPTIQTFILSAIWHGVYPGYYLTFLTGVVMTLAARAVSIKNFISYFNGSLLALLQKVEETIAKAGPGQHSTVAGSEACAWRVCPGLLWAPRLVHLRRPDTRGSHTVFIAITEFS